MYLALVEPHLAVKQRKVGCHDPHAICEWPAFLFPKVFSSSICKCARESSGCQIPIPGLNPPLYQPLTMEFEDEGDGGGCQVDDGFSVIYPSAMNVVKV